MIVLTDKIRITVPYEGKSKFDFWKDIVKGDVLTIAMQLKFTGKYKPTLVITNERTKQKFYESLNMIHNYLEKVAYEEVIDRGVSNDVKNKLVRWLSEEYSQREAREMIEESTITEFDGKIHICYINGMVDVVRINNNGCVEQIR